MDWEDEDTETYPASGPFQEVWCLIQLFSDIVTTGIQIRINCELFASFCPRAVKKQVLTQSSFLKKRLILDSEESKGKRNGGRVKDSMLKMSSL